MSLSALAAPQEMSLSQSAGHVQSDSPGGPAAVGWLKEFKEVFSGHRLPSAELCSRCAHALCSRSVLSVAGRPLRDLRARVWVIYPPPPLPDLWVRVD